MKTTILTAIASAVLLLALSGCGSSEFGKPLTLNQTTGIGEILKDPQKYHGKRVLVEGKVTEVCSMAGCWVMLQGGAETEQIRFKVDDGVIVFPMSVAGKTARAEGVVTVKTKSVEELIAEGEHHADETGGKFDASTVTGPKVVVQIEGEGAVVN